METQLEAGASETDTADLQQLRDNLSQLIALTEGDYPYPVVHGLSEILALCVYR